MTEITARLSTALANRYQLERYIGEVGMATVYLEDLRHKRKVAVKVLRPELAAVLGAERFLQEITTTANLQHPHISRSSIRVKQIPSLYSSEMTTWTGVGI